MEKGKHTLYAKCIKRVLDFTLSLIALIVLSPLLLILTVIGAIAMKGNPFFCQKRPGMVDKRTGKERIFTMIKFRTMSNAKDKDGKLLPDADRLNKYGVFLRASSMDELPELLNILVGQMSIVGPRPLLVRDMTFMTDEQRRRHTVRAGLTGLAQVNGRNDITWEERFTYDLRYIDEGITFKNDAVIILKTIKKVFVREGITEDDSVTSTDLGDYLLAQGAVDQSEYDQKQQAAKVELNKTNI